MRRFLIPRSGIFPLHTDTGFLYGMSVKRPGKPILILTVLLFVMAGFAAWAWFRPYAWGVDEAARCKVVGVQLRADSGYYWVEPHLRIAGGQEIDLRKPIRLISGSGAEFEAAQTTFGGEADKKPDELWLKFWVRKEDLEGGLNLKINDGHLILKSSKGPPQLGTLGFDYFTSPSW